MISSGLMLDSQLPFGTDKEALRTCYFTEEALAVSPLMPYFDTTAFNSKLEQDCDGKETCTPTFALNNYVTLPPSMQYENIIVFA